MRPQLTVEQGVSEGWFRPNPSGMCECGCGEPTRLAPSSSRVMGWVKGEPIRYLRGHLRGTGHPNWKEDDLTYFGIHSWLSRVAKKTGRCAECNVQGRTEWANICIDYSRRLEDYQELCIACHRRFDEEKDLRFAVLLAQRGFEGDQVVALIRGNRQFWAKGAA